jgi:hypothetical protein
MGNIARKLGLQTNQEKNKIYDSGKKKHFKTKYSKMRYLKINNY